MSPTLGEPQLHALSGDTAPKWPHEHQSYISPFTGSLEDPKGDSQASDSEMNVL